MASADLIAEVELSAAQSSDAYELLLELDTLLDAFVGVTQLDNTPVGQLVFSLHRMVHRSCMAADVAMCTAARVREAALKGGMGAVAPMDSPV